ncbi:MAG: sn-glycerol-3-phosphate import ATP-binding protein UgpC [Alphaproteobacteria bacterium]|jgi:sn-glycerol 3-phosphate transport system ATP-binding protein|nr:sn-glycerol-3-phosphate import ATP-binding protein UgpC [Alphaproteobacteria bacterium]MDP6566126.1 sn-glycerol-3-phosphate import ATP-binding protein UgpC [Alphaproteobacteria bacterium]MDP6813784.1 sn-glycerol-3-phosphate import ATP-binding protein UgpC [Alphaproteobacteria bacterium]
MAGVHLQDVEKVYPNGFKAIHGIDVDVADGEFLVLVGPSGCGKSTLLRMVAGLETISGGEISIGDRVVNDLEPMERDIAMVFQNYALYPHMTCYNNMAYGLRNRGMSKPDIESRVREAARILELDGLLDRRPNQLSGGQRQRVAMGRAIVREPAVFLFDEPLSNLDAKLRVQMRIEIKRLHAELNITSIYVTHDQVEAMTLGHRLMVLNEGNMEQLGTPIELYERPATTFVAGFIGSPSMNFLAARVADDGRAVVLSDGESWARDNGGGGHAGRAVTLGVRPEHFEISGEDGGAAHLQVSLIEHLGADTLIHGHFGDDRNDLTVRLQGVVTAKMGDVVPLRVTSEHLHLFDPENGRRLD